MTMLGQYYQINEAVGINIHILQPADAHASLSACAVVVHNNRLNIEKKLPEIQNVEELARHFRAKSAVSLNLTGKGIVQKRIEKTETVSQGIFSKLLPNANIDDFYIQNFISGEYSFVSAIRKPEADRWITYLQKQGFMIMMLSLGPFPVTLIMPQLNAYDSEIIFNGHHIKRNEDGQWTAAEYHEGAVSPFPLKAETEKIDEKILLPYAAAFQLVLAGKVDAVHAPVPLAEKALRQTLEEKRLRVQGFFILCIFFILLLFNFVVLSWLSSSNLQLTAQVSRFTQSTDDLRKINDQVQQKEALLKTLGWEGLMNKSAMLDQLASLLPDGITWTEAAIDPVDQAATRVQKSVAFFSRRIRITGNSEKIIPVNEWMARIKTKSWVKNVQLDSYALNSELNTGQFVVLIDY